MVDLHGPVSASLHWCPVDDSPDEATAPRASGSGKGEGKRPRWDVDPSGSTVRAHTRGNKLLATSCDYPDGKCSKCTTRMPVLSTEIRFEHSCSLCVAAPLFPARQCTFRGGPHRIRDSLSLVYSKLPKNLAGSCCDLGSPTPLADPHRPGSSLTRTAGYSVSATGGGKFWLRLPLSASGEVCAFVRSEHLCRNVAVPGSGWQKLPRCASSRPPRQTDIACDPTSHLFAYRPDQTVTTARLLGGRKARGVYSFPNQIRTARTMTSSTPVPKNLVVPAAGIDVGFFQTKFTAGAGPDGKLAVDMFPSLVPTATVRYTDLPGMTRSDCVVLPHDGVDYLVGKSAPDYMNAAGMLRAPSQDFSNTPRYRALLLGALYYIAKQHGVDGSLTIECLCLGLPMSSLAQHAAGLRSMATGTHQLPSPLNSGATIPVHVKKVVVIAQPQGALFNMALQSGRPIPSDQRTLILDMGGGTFDWLMSVGYKPQFSLSDAAPLGALAAAAAVCDKLDPTYRKDPAMIAKVDTALRTGAQKLSVLGVDHDMKKLWPAAIGVVADALEEMAKKLGQLASIDQVLITGGGAELVARALPKALPQLQRLAKIDSDPVTSNVRGFYVAAQNFANRA